MVLRIAVLDVGHGDCTVVFLDDNGEKSSVVVIDCGDGPTLLDFLKQEGIRTIDLAILTHNDWDHIGGIRHILGREDIRIRRLALHMDLWEWDKAKSNANKTRFAHLAQRIREEAEGRHLVLAEVSPDCHNLQRALDQLGFNTNLLYPSHYDKLLAPSQPVRSLRNRLSGVLRVEHNGSSALFCGDLDLRGWQNLVSSGRNHQQVKADLLMFPHHGARLVDGTDQGDAEQYAEELLADVSPRYIVISTGQKLDWQHPNATVLAALRKHCASVQGRFLCTEVTRVCEQYFSNKRDAVLGLLPSLHHSWRFSPGSSGSGCPCAGTIHLELRPKGHIEVLPRTPEHGQVIQLFADHQCC